MNALSISLLAVLLLPLAGCGEKTAGSNAEVAASAVPKTVRLIPINYDPFDFEDTKKHAEAGNVDAQYSLGRWYAPSNIGAFDDLIPKNNLVPKDAAKAFEWLKKSADQGHANAQYQVGKMYYNGQAFVGFTGKLDSEIGSGSAKSKPHQSKLLSDDEVFGNPQKAAEWFQKAAAQGHIGAQFNLGVMYDKGEGVPKNAAKAIEWYEKTTTQGNAIAYDPLGLYPRMAAFNLGVMYDKGEGIPKDASKAAEWYQKAAAQGHAVAQSKLGVMYAIGEGVPKDAAKAVEWVQKAAAQGHVGAQFNLGRMYYKGEGVSKDIVRAYTWFNLSAAQGDTDAKELRDLLEKILTSDQQAEAQRLASNWKKGDILQASSDNASGSISPNGKPSKKGTGTAFAVSGASHALTNHHVINGCTEVKVAGREGIAKVITSDSVNDLALLQLPGKSKGIASLNPEPGKLRQGEDIIVFGYPLEWALSSGGNLTPGTISALTGLSNNTNQIQITAPIQPGSSGSPVMDKKGNVVGMVSMKLDDGKMAKATGQVGQNVNFAVNGQTVRAFLDANKVPYKTGGGFFSLDKSNADIAEEASKWTVLVECWK